MLLIKTEKNEFLGPLQSVCGIVERRHTLPILSNVLLERTDEKLTLLATDIEIQIKTTIAMGAAPGEPMSVTVGARKLQDILRALQDGADVSLVLEDKRLQVRSGKSRFSLQTLPAVDYPRMLQTEGEHARFQLPQKRFARLLGMVQYAMAQQDIRYYLNGLLLVVSGRELRAVATDGHRLAYASEPLEEETQPVEVILPRKSVQELSRLLADSDDPLHIQLSGNQMTLRFGPTELVSKLIDGRFPDYDRVVPQSHMKLLRLNRLQLLHALQRAAILSNEKFRGVRMVLSDGTLKIVSSNAEQEEAQEDIEVAYRGDALDIGFNVTYLLDVLNHLSAEEVECHLADASSSALITIPGNPNFKYVVMPLRI